MKIFAFVMAIIIMIMSCTPCKDSPLTMKVKKGQTSLTVAAGHDHEEKGDDCSPLCTCACCSAHSNPQSFIIASGHLPNIALRHIASYSGALISISLPIWQPPQLLA
ncbi:DUF6660 family protein [Paraflavitalea pollutisoli]|uniref:DUF6660 family protein n=1 Tax=Paraflavitalea pollutisoli TaxID=3034143 RepID=UPI0023EB76E1|nr:DUF6660 family protein [Paraflavitalea sp. H1-2-19X]